MLKYFIEIILQMQTQLQSSLADNSEPPFLCGGGRERGEGEREGENVCMCKSLDELSIIIFIILRRMNCQEITSF